MEALPVQIRFSDPDRDMVGSGSIGSQRFQLKSQGPKIGSKITVAGMAGDREFTLEGRTKNLITRDFDLNGSWAGLTFELNIEVDGPRYRIQGEVDGETIRLVATHSRDGELRANATTPSTDLRFHDSNFDWALEGTVERFIDAAIYAAILPCLLRSQEGTIDGFSMASPT